MGTPSPYPWCPFPPNNNTSPYNTIPPNPQTGNHPPIPAYPQEGIRNPPFSSQSPPYDAPYPNSTYPQSQMYGAFYPPPPPPYTESPLPYNFPSYNPPYEQYTQPSAPLEAPEVPSPPSANYLINKDKKQSATVVPPSTYTVASTDYQDCTDSLKKGPRIGFEESQFPVQSALYPRLPSVANQTLPNFTPTSHKPSQTVLKTPLPPDLVLLWDSGEAVKIYFVQKEGHVVSPDCALKLHAYKFPTFKDPLTFTVGSLSGSALGCTILLTLESCWRLGLCKNRSYIVKGLFGELAIYDTSTQPARYVILEFHKSMKREERQRLDVLLQASSAMVDEPSNVVDKLESSVGSVFVTLTEGVDSMVKKSTPGLHKNTKWLRKGTGQVVRFGSSVVSKGVHFVSDSIIDKEAPKEACTIHRELYDALTTFRQAVESKKVTKIQPL